MSQPNQTESAPAKGKKQPVRTGSRPNPLVSKPGRGPYVANLARIEGVRQEIARLYRDWRRGELESIEAHRMAHVLHLCARLIAGEELEARVEALEKRRAAE